MGMRVGWITKEATYLQNILFDVPEGDNQYSNDVMSLSSQVDDGNTVRDMIALNMWNDYSHNSS